MTTSAATITGGQFLTTAVQSDEVFTREQLSEEQRLFGRTALEFMQKEVLPVAPRLYEHDWVLTRQLLKKASELDLLRLEIPTAHGGLGLDLISASYVGEQIAINPSFGGSLGAHTSIGTLPLVYFGTEEQKTRYLPRLASGDLIGAYALTEPQSGSDALAARATATLTPDGRHYLLNGQKMWITNGGFADLFTIFAKVNGDQFTAFLVERGMGVVSGRDEIKLGLDGSSTTALMLDNVKVPVENVLGTVGQGHKVAFNVLNFGRVKLGARNMSGVKQALNHAVKYAKERRQFGRAIAEFGLIKQKIAGMTVRAFVGDAMSYRTLGDVDRVLDAGDRTDGARVMKTIESFSVECSINKVWTSEALAWAVDEALQVYGGNGYSREFPAERAYRDARITRIYEGTNEINRLLVPTRLLKQSPDQFTPEAARRALADTPAAAPTGALGSERAYVAQAKRLAIGLLGQVAATYGDRLKDAQEVQAQIADIVIEAYAIESGLARAEKMTSRADAKAPLAADAVRIYASDASDKIAAAARQVTAALEAEGGDPSVTAAARRLATHPAVDAIAARRRVADAVIDAGRYIFWDMNPTSYALFVLFAINLMNFFDRQIIGGVGEGIRREWGLTDTALGLLGTVFTLLYAVVGLPLGRLSDRSQRRLILSAGVFAWSVLTALSGAARNFSQLIIARLGVGVGEATCSPASTSLIGDLVPASQRARAVAVWMLGLPLGLGLANGAGGWILQNWGWRNAFYVAAIPGILCAIAALWIVEPARGKKEEHAIGARRREGNPYLLVLSIPTMLWIIVSGALHNFNMYALGSFVAPFLVRFHHMTFQNAGWVAAVVFGFSGIVGLTAGGALADRLYRTRVDGRLMVGCGSIVISTPLMFLALGRPVGDIAGFALLMGAGIGVMYAYYSTVYSTLHDVVEPSLRGTAMALYFCAMYLLGASLGPVGTGLASDYYTFQAASAAGAVQPLPFGELMAAEFRSLVGESKGFDMRALEPFRAQGLHTAMYIVPMLAAILSVVLFAASKTVKKDVARLQDWMRTAGAAAKAS